MPVRVVTLGSGSRGNATLVDFDGLHVLVDAGLSCRDLGRRLAEIGVAPESVAFLLLSHEHQDHTRGVERFSLNHRVPVACSPETLEAMNFSPRHVHRFVPLAPAERNRIEGIDIDPFPVPHDAADPLGFVLEARGVRVGFATDLGHVTTLVAERLRGCNAMVVEFNHDPVMLRDGPYPWQLKQRVAGRLGHLSNSEAAGLLRRAAGDDCRGVVLAHLSEKNNTHALARAEAARALADAGRRRVELRVARQRRPTAELVL